MASSSTTPAPGRRLSFVPDNTQTAEASNPSRQSLGRRFLTRAKSVLRKKDGSRRFSLLSTLSRTDQPALSPDVDASVALEPEAAPVPEAVPEPVHEPVAEPVFEPVLEPVSEPAPAHDSAPVALSHTVFEQATARSSKDAHTASWVPDSQKVQHISRRQLFEDRARQMNLRLGVDLFPSPWNSVDGFVMRIERPIRMRIRRRCHECNSHFTGSKQCPQCQHTLCRRCTRKPAKLPEAERAVKNARVLGLMRASRESQILVPDPFPDDRFSKKPIVIIRPSRPMTKLVLKKPRQRIRRNCCQCRAFYTSSVKICTSCHHERCTDCPREPAKKKKFPYGYPGDAPGLVSNAFFQCHECLKVFTQGAANDTECDQCGHPKCDECPRMQPHKVEPELDPEILRRVIDRLEKLGINKPSLEPLFEPSFEPPLESSLEPPLEPSLEP